MNSVDAIGAVAAAPPALLQLGTVPATPPAASTARFSDIMSAGIAGIEDRLRTANSLVQQFTLGEQIPVHQVTFALEQAKLSVELAMQVRGRLLDSYRELMNMQL